jgi:hypothetical protein
MYQLVGFNFLMLAFSERNQELETLAQPGLLAHSGLTMGLMFVWWSAMYWKYAKRMLSLTDKGNTQTASADSLKAPKEASWVLAPYHSFKKIYLP